MNFNRLITLSSARLQLDYRCVSKKIITADGKEVPKEKNREKRITLISPDQSVTTSDLKSAQSLSLRRDLKLVKVVDVDVKTKRPVYKLMTSSEYHQEELKQKKERQEARKNTFIKGEKLINLSSRIGEHDLMTGIKKMLKLLEKHYEVRVVLSGTPDDMDKIESMASVIESNIKSIGKLVQKRTKSNTMKFQLIPLKDKGNGSQTENVSSSQTENVSSSQTENVSSSQTENVSSSQSENVSSSNGSPKDNRGPL